MTTTSGITTPAPGRLGDPMMDLGSDPRSDPRMVAAFGPLGLDKVAPPPPVGRTSSREEQLAYIAGFEADSEAVFREFIADLPAIDGISHSAQTITGFDGNDIALYISRPADKTGALPGVLHIHGGGMVALSAAGPGYAMLRDAIARTGVAVIGVEFRNGGGALGAYPYPAGLNDCTAALHWVHDNRNVLGISTLTLAGESGGGNLLLATTLKAKRDGCIQMIDGVCALVPYISGIYGRPESERAAELPSLVENDGYFISCAGMDVAASVYDPGDEHATDPLCWPYHATVDQLAGLPPHLISVNELDPLRDEGIAYYHKLNRAGVPTTLRTVRGACHAGDIMLPAHMPDAYEATIASIHDFATNL
jgi:acetyl esterase/lipase